MRNVAKEVYVVWLDIKFINFKVVALANFADEVFDITSHAIEFHRVFGVFGLPYKMEAVLANRMAKMF